MSKIISIQDTHRLPYANGTVTAKKPDPGDTTPLKFYDRDGNLLGDTVYTNAKGYLCDGAGNLYMSGVFLNEDAEVNISFADGSSTTWRVGTDDDTPVNDGRLMGKTADSTPENPVLTPIFTANQAGDSLLSWNNLLDTPRVNEWMEVETVVTLENTEDSVQVGMYTKTLTIVNDSDNPVVPHDYGRVLTPNGNEFELTLIPDPSRVAQIIAVQNFTGYRIVLKNEDDSVICSVNDYVDTDSNSVLIGLFSAGGGFKVIGPTGTSSVQPFVLDALSDWASTLPLNDYSPDIIQVQATVNATDPDDEAYYDNLTLNISNRSTKARVVKLWLQNMGVNAGVKVVDKTGGNNNFIGSLGNFTIAEILLVPGIGILPLNGFLNKVNPTALVKTGTGSVTPVWVPPDTNLVAASGDVGIDIWLDDYTNKTVKFILTNTSASSIPVNFYAGYNSGTVLASAMAAYGGNEFTLVKTGQFITMIEGSQVRTVAPNGATAETGYDVFTYPSVGSGSILRFDADDCDGAFGVSFGYHPNDYNEAVLTIPSFVGTISLTIEIATIISGSSKDLNIYLDIAGNVTRTHQLATGTAIIDGDTPSTYHFYIPKTKLAVMVSSVDGFNLTVNSISNIP